jgi:hypothetical protein
MADTLLRWSGEQPDRTDTVQAALPAVRALWLRARLRELHRGDGLLTVGALARRLRVDAAALRSALQRHTFSACHADVLGHSGPLQGRRVPGACLVGEIHAARRLIRRLGAKPRSAGAA